MKQSLGACCIYGLLFAIAGCGWTSAGENAVAYTQNYAGLPDPIPPFLPQESRRAQAVLKVTQARQEKQAGDAPALWSGNKRIGFREIAGQGHAGTRWFFQSDQTFALIINNREIMSGQFWGGNKAGFGWPFKLKDGTVPAIMQNADENSITYSREYHITPDETATFRYTLKALPEGRVRIAWDLGISEEKLASYPKDIMSNVALFLSLTMDYRNLGVSCNGKKLTLLPEARVSPVTYEQMKKEKSERLWFGESGAEIAVSPEKPLDGFLLSVAAQYEVDVLEGRTHNGAFPQLGVRIYPKERKPTGEVVVDLLEVAGRSADAPPPVANIDFWARDAMHVPQPVTRNLFPNPGFEQGLRYWAWWWGGGEYVATAQPAYSISNDCVSGKKSLLIQRGQGNYPLMSFPIPVEKGKTYTVSFYGKAEKADTGCTVSILSPVVGSKYTWMEAFKGRRKMELEWKRQSFRFVADQPAVTLFVALTGASPVWLDNVQIEEGEVPSEFTSAPVEGTLLTADPDNSLNVGDALKPSFSLQGKPGTQGDVTISVRNYYRENVYSGTHPFALDAAGNAIISLPFDEKAIGSGVFVVKAEYHLPAMPPFYDFYRFSIMPYLANKHVTKNVFGTLSHAPRITRGDDLGRQYMRWGWGSTTYGGRKCDVVMEQKYGIENMFYSLCDLAGSVCTKEEKQLMDDAASKWEEVTPENAKAIEALSYKIACAYPWGKYWSFNTESEGRNAMLRAGNYAEYFKLQKAMHDGVKRANPQALVYPDGGTSGFNVLRGYRETEGYLKAAQGVMKWDAIAVHPYGDLDGVRGWSDLDECTRMLLDLMKKYGYGSDTPVHFTEGFNMPDMYLPEWGSDTATDFYNSGRPTYDSSWREFLHASWAARSYIMTLKYWPQVQSFNIWISRPTLDYYLSPLAICKAVNTLGNLLGNPVYQADYRPAAGIRGYAFTDEQKRGVVAVWCAVDKVEEGAERGPELRVRFSNALPEFIDLMGNLRKVAAIDGEVAIQLTPAPLFLRSTKDGLKQLLSDLNDAEVSGAGSALRVAVQPEVDGALVAALANQTNRALAGKLKIGGNLLPFEIAGQGKLSLPMQQSVDPTPGKMNEWQQQIGVEFANGRQSAVEWDMSYFYVPCAKVALPLDPDAPAWATVPAIAINNWHIGKEPGKESVPARENGDMDVTYKVAWDERNLYVCVRVKDDQVVFTEPKRWKPEQLYMHDGCLEVYFDTGANGRSNSVKGFDQDDYRYDVYAGSAKADDGTGTVCRFRAPYHQLAGGLDMPTKEQAAKGVQSFFKRTPDGYAYVLIFAQRYIEPLRLEKGTRAGFALYLHDNDDPARQWPGKGRSMATAKGVACDYHPELWPVMVLGE